VSYEVPGYDSELLRAMSENAVLIKDYTPQLAETVIPRAVLIDGVLEMMSECLPMARTALIASSGVKGMRVGSDDEADEVREANEAIAEASMTGMPYIPIKGMQEFQELGEGSALKVEDFLLDMQALDNFRLSLHGLDSGGLFQKKSHMLEAEQSMNEGRSRAALQDGLALRQSACDIINGIHKSVAGRVSGLCHRIGVRDDVVMTGGVAQNHGIVKALQEQLGHEIHTTPLTQYNGALGAALFAYQKALKNQ